MRKPMMIVDVFIYRNAGAWLWFAVARNVCPGMVFERRHIVTNKNPAANLSNEPNPVFRYGSVANAKKSAHQALDKIKGVKVGREWERRYNPDQSPKSIPLRWIEMKPRARS